MNLLRRSKTGPSDIELEEWDRHHNDPRSKEGFAIWTNAINSPNLTRHELYEQWHVVNKLVGDRAPSDYGEFVAYGYLQGRMDAFRGRP